MGSLMDTGASSRAKKDSQLQQDQLKKQQQKEDARAAEEKDEAARRQAIAAKGGARGSLLTGSESGVVANANPTGAATMKPKTTAKMGG